MVMSMASVAALYRQNAGNVLQTVNRLMPNKVGAPLENPLNNTNPLAAGSNAATARPALNSFLSAVESFSRQTRDDVVRAENVSIDAVIGQANVNDLVTAVSTAETSLQTIVAIRDRVLSAYQEIMRMPI